MVSLTQEAEIIEEQVMQFISKGNIAGAYILLTQHPELQRLTRVERDIFRRVERLVQLKNDLQNAEARGDTKKIKKLINEIDNLERVLIKELGHEVKKMYEETVIAAKFPHYRL